MSSNRMQPQPQSNHKVTITPPGSTTANPLTPPATEKKSASTILRILEDIKRRKGKISGADEVWVPDPWVTYPLSAEDYQELLQQIQRDKSLAGFVEQKLRLDYFQSLRRLVLRMPTPIHEFFLLAVVKEIILQLEAFEGPAGEYARDIRCGGSTRLKFDDPGYGTHNPDGQFKHRAARFPGVVIEVSYTQNTKAVRNLAEDYILGSDGNIKVVIGLDIEYTAQKGKMASWSIWEPRTEVDNDNAEGGALTSKMTVDHRVFRTLTGSPPTSPPDAALHIPLHAFGPLSSYPFNVPPTGSISIPTQILHKFLADAEEAASTTVQKIGCVDSVEIRTWNRKRRRVATPTEELEEVDEKRWKGEEDKVAERELKNDKSFNGSNGS